jgi:hypothetical protein
MPGIRQELQSFTEFVGGFICCNVEKNLAMASETSRRHIRNQLTKSVFN